LSFASFGPTFILKLFGIKTMNEHHVKYQKNPCYKMYFFKKGGTKLAAI